MQTNQNHILKRMLLDVAGILVDVAGMLLGCCWDVAGMLLGCCWDVAGMLLDVAGCCWTLGVASWMLPAGCCCDSYLQGFLLVCLFVCFL
jgi:hypothetical protein